MALFSSIHERRRVFAFVTDSSCTVCMTITMSTENDSSHAEIAEIHPKALEI